MGMGASAWRELRKAMPLMNPQHGSKQRVLGISIRLTLLLRIRWAKKDEALRDESVGEWPARNGETENHSAANGTCNRHQTQCMSCRVD